MQTQDFRYDKQSSQRLVSNRFIMNIAGIFLIFTGFMLTLFLLVFAIVLTPFVALKRRWMQGKTLKKSVVRRSSNNVNARDAKANVTKGKVIDGEYTVVDK